MLGARERIADILSTSVRSALNLGLMDGWNVRATRSVGQDVRDPSSLSNNGPIRLSLNSSQRFRDNQPDAENF
jgi:hypothetical protein